MTLSPTLSSSLTLPGRGRRMKCVRHLLCARRWLAGVNVSSFSHPILASPNPVSGTSDSPCLAPTRAGLSPGPVPRCQSFCLKLVF